jgi:hypothetical protein
MAREERVKLQARDQVNQKETFRYSTPGLHVEASANADPVKAFADQEANQIMEALSDGTRAATGLADEIGKSEEKAGKEAAFSGATVQEAQTKKFFEGYDSIKGAAAVNDYDNEMFKLYQEGGNLSAEDWVKAKKEITNKYVQGKSASYLKGFVPGALDRDNHYDKEFSKRYFVQQQNELLSDFTKTAKQGFQRISDDSAIEDKHGAMRAHLTSLQEKGKALGLTRQQVSKAYLDAVGEEAVTLGRPELLEFAKREDPSGNSLYNNTELQDKYYGYARAATAKRDALIHKSEEEKKKAEVEVKNNVERAIIDAFYSRDPAKVTQGLKVLQGAKGIMPPNEYEHYTRAFSELNGGGAIFQEHSDFSRLMAAKAGATEGTYGIAELRADLPYLSRQDAAGVLEKINAKRAHDLNKAESAGKRDQNEQDSDEIKNIGKRQARAPKEIGMGGVEKLIDPHASYMREQIYVAEFNEMFNQYYRVEKKLPDGTTNWRQATDLISQRALYKAFSKYPEGHVSIDNPDAPTPKAKPSGNPQPKKGDPNNPTLQKLRGL